MRESTGEPRDGGVDDSPVGVVRVQLAALGPPHEGHAGGRVIIDEPVATPGLAHDAVVGVTQRHLEVRYVAHERLREGCVPLVEVEGAHDVAAARREIGREPLGGKPSLRPRARRAV